MEPNMKGYVDTDEELENVTSTMEKVRSVIDLNDC